MNINIEYVYDRIINNIYQNVQCHHYYDLSFRLRYRYLGFVILSSSGLSLSLSLSPFFNGVTSQLNRMR